MASNDTDLDDDTILDVTGTGHSRSYYYDFLERRLSRLENQMAAISRTSVVPRELLEARDTRRATSDKIRVYRTTDERM